MNFYRKYMDGTIQAIAHLTRINYNAIISIKKIRGLYNINSSNHSKIAFYWRNLETLEEIGVLKRINTKTPKLYRLNNHFKFFELLHNSYVHQDDVSDEKEIPAPWFNKEPIKLQE